MVTSLALPPGPLTLLRTASRESAYRGGRKDKTGKQRSARWQETRSDLHTVHHLCGSDEAGNEPGGDIGMRLL